ncbi:unnamed protein product [Paramecium sonneborni]|uniref:Uncharacterized protein n=1 Tax=Paramecium sonneborni TaxID=65129 RepID=A0A8S1LSL0_9CILI|nr:unnamed protein product [Paramecium sonneborni]
MTEAKSKRDQIWEEKRRQREERLLRMEGQMLENNGNQFQLPPARLDDQVPISYPSQSQEYEPYMPPEPYVPIEMNRISEPPRMNQGSNPQQSDFKDNRENSQFQQQPALQNPIKQQQDDYREYLKKQMEEKETEKKRRRDGTNNNQYQIQQVQIQQQSVNQAPLPVQPINKQKQEYGEFLRQQMMEKEEQKKRRIQSGNNQNNQQYQQAQQYQIQQQPQQYQQQIYQPQQQENNQSYSYGNQQSNTPYQNQQPQQIDQNRLHKQEYGDYLRMQMQLKEQEKNDRKKNLQQRMETGDSFPFGKGGGGAPNQRVVNNQIQQQNYNQQQIYQQPNYQQQNQFIQQQQNYQQPFQQVQYQQSLVTPQQYQYQEQNLPSGFDQQPILMEPQVDPQLKGGRNRLMLENQNIDDIKKKEQQKLEMQRVLQEQIEQKKRKKEQEKLQKEMEDKMEEEKFRRQKEQEELEKKREEDLKKQQQGKFEQDNIDLKEKRRLERIQERKNRKNQQQQDDDQQQQQNFQLFEPQQQQQLPPPSRNIPPSQPKSENYLKDFLMNEKIKEGVSPHQSILDFYRNGPLPMNKAEVQQNREIDDIKRQMLQQQENLQQQIQQVMNQAQMAIEGRNKAEQELIALKEQVKNKYLQEERHHDDLMIALVKNDPKWEKQVFPPHLLAQAEIGAYKDLAMPALNENFNFPNLNQNKPPPFAPAYESKPLVLKEESKEQKQYFREQFGLQSLVSDSNMVPIDHNASLVPQIQPINKKVSEVQLDKIDELNAHFEDSLKLGIGETYQIKNDNFKKRPPSNNGQHPSWNVPSIDSEFVKEIDDLLKYKPAQQTLNRPPSGFTKNGFEQKQLQQSISNRPPSQINQRPPSAFGRAAQGVLGSADLNYKGITLDSQFPDMTMIKKATNTDTFDIAGIHKKMDQKIMHLNEIEEDDDLQKLDKLLYQYNQ